MKLAASGGRGTPLRHPAQPGAAPARERGARTAGMARKAGRCVLPQGATAEEAFRATLLHCLRHVRANIPAIVESREPEGVHQMRVGMRRLRAALAAWGPELRTPGMEDLRARAKRLADALAPARDLDVFAGELLAPAVAENGGVPGVLFLQEEAEAARRMAWQQAVAAIEAPAFAAFLCDLAAAAETRIWRRGRDGHEPDPARLAALRAPASQAAAATLCRRLRKAKKLGRRIAGLDAAERHRLRIALKKLRYAAEFAAPLYPKRKVTKFLKSLSGLQDIFGVLNDVAVARTTLERLSARAGETDGARAREIGFAAGLVYGWHLERADRLWSKAQKRWKSFARTSPFWASGNPV